MLGFGALHVINGQITTGELLVLLSYIASVYVPLESIGNVVGNLHQQFVFLSVVMSLLDEEPEVKEAPDAIDVGRSEGRITLDNISFTYQGRENTIKNISFEGRPGQRIAVVGPTGAGKTTLSNLLVRFYDPHEGAIQVFEVNFIGLTKSQFDKDKEFLNSVLSTLQYAGDAPATTAPAASAPAGPARRWTRSRMPRGPQTRTTSSPPFRTVIRQSSERAGTSSREENVSESASRVRSSRTLRS